MPDQIIVNTTPFETRVALLEGGSVAEVFIERDRDRGIVGNIYLGRVQRVLPGMQAAFIEIGLDKAAFLYVGDIALDGPLESDPDGGFVDDDAFGDHQHHHHEHGAHEHHEHAEHTDSALHSLADGEPVLDPADGSAHEGGNDDALLREKEKKERERLQRRRVAAKQRRIEELIKQGQILLVQVTKDAIGTKGPRVTCNISLPGRYLVYMPKHFHVGVSRRIVADDERTRLKTILSAIKPKEGGVVIRTVSEGLSQETLAADMDFLTSLWADVQKRSVLVGAPALIQPELDPVLKCARDLFTAEVDKFVVDSESAYQRILKFVDMLDNRLSSRVHLYKGGDAIFEHYGVETELARAMSRRVWLKSGGYLVIDQAEALTAIDVNTGRFVGKRNLEDTILRTNLEAVREVAYQLRLRNIGGMVIIDFIDMEIEEHREKVLSALEEALKRDRARSKVVKMSELGLVEMTRQRTRESIGRQLTEPCWYCEGRGVLKSKRTIVYDICRALMRQAGRFSEPAVVVLAHPEVVDMMYGEEADALSAIEAKCGKRIVVKPRGSFHQEHFDIHGTSLEAVAKK